MTSSVLPPLMKMELVVRKDGTTCFVYSEMFDLSGLGAAQIRRASLVEPDELGRWWADLSLESGPVLGPFEKRSTALAAETNWLETHIIASRQ